jgi:hypothetical protein
MVNQNKEWKYKSKIHLSVHRQPSTAVEHIIQTRTQNLTQKRVQRNNPD